MKKTLLILLVALLGSNLMAKDYKIKDNGDAMKSGGFFSSGYNVRSVCIDHIKYIIASRSGGSSDALAMTPKYIIKNGKTTIEICK